MVIEQLNPYLNFNGNAQQAIALYERALGAKTESLMRWGDMPGHDCDAADKDRVMHAVVRVGPGVLMMADSMPNNKVSPGNQHVCLQFSNPAPMQEAFDALAAGGSVTMAIHDAFWGAKFGMLTDAFGIKWMFNCATK